MSYVDELSKMSRSKDAPPIDESKKGSQSTQLIDLCDGFKFFHTPDSEAFVTFENKDHLETWPISSHGFRTKLQHLYYLKNKSAPSSQAMQDALGVLTGKANFDGPEIPVFLRIAEYNGSVFLDLANEKWEAVEVSASGWRVVADAPVKFRRSKGMLPLATPTSDARDADVAELQRFLNLESVDDFRMVVSWLLGTFNPRGPYSVLVLYAEQGSGKSTLVRVLRDLIDPNSAPLRQPPRNSDDLMVSAKNNWAVVIDNMSYLPDWLSDDLCRLATGGGLSKRQHYSDCDEVVLNATRPVILNGIDEFVARGDLASRSITLHLPTIDSKERRRERSFWTDFQLAKPRLLGSLLTGIAEALKNQDSFEMTENFRMADAWHWVSAAETAFNWPRGTCAAAFRKNQLNSNEAILNAAAIYPTLVELANEKWKNTPHALFRIVNQKRQNEEGPSDSKAWPTNPKNLTDRIRRLNPALRLAGIEVIFSRTSSNRFIEIKKLTSPPENDCIFASPSSCASPMDSASDAHDANDANDANDEGKQANSTPVEGHDPRISVEEVI